MLDGALNSDLLGCFGSHYCDVIGCGVTNLDVAIKFLLDQVLSDCLLVWVNFAILYCKANVIINLEVASKNGSQI